MTFSVQRSSAFFMVQLREFYRDFGTMFLNIIFPLTFVLALVFNHYSNPTFKFEIGVVEVAASRDSQAFVQMLGDSPSVALKSLAGETAARRAVEGGEIHAAFVIRNADFRGGRGDVELIVGARYEDFARLMLEAVRDRMRGPPAPGAKEALFQYRVISPDLPEQNDFTFTFPGMLALALVQLGLFATAVPLLQARDRGTLKYLSLTPLTRAELLFGQLGLRVTIALAQVVLILLAGSGVMSLDPGQWLAVLGTALLGIVLLVSIGYAIAGVAPSLQAGMAIILFANFSMLMGGNVFLDPNGSTVQYVAACIIPISYLADMFRQIITGQAGLWPLWTDVLVTLGWSAIAMTIALRSFRFDTGLSGNRPGRLALAAAAG
jgi:ABC-2 type transport system permease protein